MFSIFRKSYKHGFKEEDLYSPLEEHKSALLGNKLEDIWKEEHRKHKKAALHIALLRLFGFDLAVVGILKLISEMVLV